MLVNVLQPVITVIIWVLTAFKKACIIVLIPVMIIVASTHIVPNMVLKHQYVKKDKDYVNLLMKWQLIFVLKNAQFGVKHVM